MPIKLKLAPINPELVFFVLRISGKHAHNRIEPETSSVSIWLVIPTVSNNVDVFVIERVENQKNACLTHIPKTYNGAATPINLRLTAF